jgi:hypothetical protein
MTVQISSRVCVEDRLGKFMLDYRPVHILPAHNLRMTSADAA